MLHNRMIPALLAFGTAAAAFQAVPVSAEAAPDYAARTVAAYLYGTENTEEITCLFRSDLPDSHISALMIF